MTVSERFIDEIEILIANNEVRSFRDFALKLGINPQTITQIKSGKQNVTTEIISKSMEMFASFNINRIFGDESKRFEDENMILEPQEPYRHVETMAEWMTRIERELKMLRKELEDLKG